MPSTLEDVRLAARTRDGRTIRGESAITAAQAEIATVSLEPARPSAHPDALNAVRNADLIVVGPGSLYTSVLPNLMVPALGIAFQESDAMRIFVSNVATQAGETDQYSVQDHVASIEAHMGGSPFDFIVANNNLADRLPERWKSEPVRGGEARVGGVVITADVVDERNRYRHDSAKLADAILTIYHERGEAAPRPPVVSAAAR